MWGRAVGERLCVQPHWVWGLRADIYCLLEGFRKSINENVERSSSKGGLLCALLLYGLKGLMYSYLLHSQRRADLLSSEDHGALGQHLRELEGVQAQQLADVTDH